MRNSRRFISSLLMNVLKFRTGGQRPEDVSAELDSWVRWRTHDAGFPPFDFAAFLIERPSGDVAAAAARGKATERNFETDPISGLWQWIVGLIAPGPAIDEGVLADDLP